MRHLARDWVFLTTPQVSPKSEPLAWLYEDTLPPEYPYDAMYPHSRVDGVRMFPVFGPPTAEVQRLRDALEQIEREANQPYIQRIAAAALEGDE